MRTTLTIDDDVLSAARELADCQHKTVGEVLSALARKSLTPSKPVGVVRHGVPQLPVKQGSKPVTLEIVNKLRDELI